MIKIENYPNAYKEVYVILNSMSKEDISKIPEDFMNMIKNNMDDEYIFELYDDIPFEEQSLLQETKAILAYIFMNYWGTEEQKKKIKSKFEQDMIEEENAKQQYYSNHLFKENNNTNKNVIEKNNDDESTELVEYKDKNIFMKMLDSVKKIFKR